MKTKKAASTIIITLLTLTLCIMPVLTDVSYGSGECPGTKKKVTIVNPAGKVIEICVAEAAIPHICGNGEVVIPASCPCFTQDEIQEMIDTYYSTDPITCERSEGTSSISGSPCTLVECYNSSVYLVAGEGPTHDRMNWDHCEYGPVSPVNNNWCFKNGDYLLLDTDEADACVAILDTFVP